MWQKVKFMDKIETLLNRQREYFRQGRTREVSFRKGMLRKLRDAILKFEPQIEKALQDDLGKSAFEAYATETGLILEELNYHLRHLKKWSRRKRVRTPLVHLPGKSFIYPEPFGQVLIMGTWNYPMQIVLLPLVGAISAGNCAILKPSEMAPHSGKVLETLIRETFPPEYIAVVQGEVDTAQYLLQQKVDFIFFTGSTKVGKIVMEMASRNLTPVCLELGGKSPCLVDEDADIGLAARRIIWGKFINAGQTCVAPDYVLVHESVKDQLIDAMKGQIVRFFGEDPSQSPDYSRIINLTHFNRLKGYLEGIKVLAGGDCREEDRYFSPTIVEGVRPTDAVMQEEIFGPILPVIPFDNLGEAVDFVNNRPHPLALYYFTGSRLRKKDIIRLIPGGGVCINDTVTHFANLYLPVGGVGNSGMGSYHGKKSFETFTHYKSVMVKSTLADIPIRYAPYTDLKVKILRRVMG